MQNTFFREIIILALTFFPRENLLIAKNQCHLPREKNQCHFQKFRQFDEFFRKVNQIHIKFHQFDEFFREFDQIHNNNCLIFAWINCLFSKLCRNTIAQLFLGMHWNCQSLVSHLFIPRGFAPWDEKMTPSGLAISMHPSKWSCNNIMRSCKKSSKNEQTHYFHVERFLDF